MGAELAGLLRGQGENLDGHTHKDTEQSSLFHPTYFTSPTLVFRGLIAKQSNSQQRLDHTYPSGEKSILSTDFRCPSRNIMQRPVRRSHTRPKASIPLYLEQKECLTVTDKLVAANTTVSVFEKPLLLDQYLLNQI